MEQIIGLVIPKDSALAPFLPIFYTLGLGSVLTSVIYFCYNFLYNRIWKRNNAYLTIDSGDPLFGPVNHYLYESGLMKKDLSSLTAKLANKQDFQHWWEEREEKDVKNADCNVVEYETGSGRHSFRYKGVKIYLLHAVGETIVAGSLSQPLKQESLKFSCFGGHNLRILEQFVEEAYIANNKKEENKTHLYIPEIWSGKWRKQTSKHIRKFESVILDEGIAEEIVEDIVRFQGQQEWYQKTGVPYRRGYLLYGPPGTGKTSFILAIAGKLNLNVCPLNLSHPYLNDERVCELLENVPKNAMVLLEDVDALFLQRDGGSSEKKSAVSFSGLINALDGVRSAQGRILIMTTNHKEKLDGALTRPGRADVHIKLNHASESQAHRLFLKFFPGQNELAKEFSQKLPEYKVSMAKLQGHFVKNMYSIEKVIPTMNSLFEVEQYEKEMFITDWLLRLNIPQYASYFAEQGIKRIDDLMLIENPAREIKIKDDIHKQRVVKMMEGDADFVKKFRLMSKNQLRGFFNGMLNNSNLTEELTNMVPENLVTEFQLRDRIDQSLKITEKEIKEELKKLIQRNQDYEKYPELKMKLETKFEEVKVDYKVDIKKLFMKLGFKQYIPKLEESQLYKDTDIFLELKDGELESELGIKSYQDKKKLKTKIEDLKKNRKEHQEKLDEKRKNCYAKELEKLQFSVIQEEKSDDEKEDEEEELPQPTNLFRNHSSMLKIFQHLI